MEPSSLNAVLHTLGDGATDQAYGNHREGDLEGDVHRNRVVGVGAHAQHDLAFARRNIAVLLYQRVEERRVRAEQPSVAVGAAGPSVVPVCGEPFP